VVLPFFDRVAKPSIVMYAREVVHEVLVAGHGRSGLMFPSASVADPVAITSGSITFTDEPGGFHVAGSGFDVFVGWFPEGVGIRVPPVLPDPLSI
jgi:hypothetical protein